MFRTIKADGWRAVCDATRRKAKDMKKNVLPQFGPQLCRNGVMCWIFAEFRDNGRHTDK
jgi:hypothetical protein